MLGKTTSVMLLQFQNAYLCIDVTCPDIITSIKELQPENADVGIYVIPLPKVTLLRAEQLLKRPLPIDDTLSGSIILVRLEQPEKVAAPMMTTPEPISTCLRLVQFSKTQR